MKVLVYIETKEGSPVQGSLELLTAAKKLGETLAVAVEDKDAAEKAAALGAKVTVLKTGDASEDAQTAALEGYIRETQPELVLFSGTQIGKDLAPRLAQRFGAGCVTDVTAIEKAGEGVDLYARHTAEPFWSAWQCPDRFSSQRSAAEALQSRRQQRAVWKKKTRR